MAKKKNNDLFSSLRGQGLRKSVAKALAELESGSRETRANAEKLARRAINDLRAAADSIEKRLESAGSSVSKRAARTRRRTTAKRKTTARKAAPRKTAARKTTARKTTARKTTARKAAPRKTTARKTTARKAAPRKTARKSATKRS